MMSSKMYLQEVENFAEDIVNFCDQGFCIYDDNEPSPENIPTGEEAQLLDSGFKEGQSWEWDGIDRRSIVKPKKEGHTYKNNFTPCGVVYSDVIVHFLTLTFLAETVFTNTYNAIMALGEPEMVWGEFLHF